MKKNAPASRNAGLAIMLLAILVLLALVALVVYQQFQPQKTPVAVESAGLISDDRLIFGGTPRATRPEAEFTLLKRIGYVAGYSESRKDPVWVSYRVMHMDHPFNLPRPKGNFLVDTRTKARVKHDDFTGTGFDRGHMAPNSAIAHCYGHDAQLETFLLSNICPQSASLNQNVWEHLEKAEFVYADRFGEVWVLDGPIFGDLNGETTRTLQAGIAVPRAFYKIIIENQNGALDACAVIMPQRVRGTELPAQFAASIDDIEKQTGLEFLWKLPPDAQRRLKSRPVPVWPADRN